MAVFVVLAVVVVAGAAGGLWALGRRLEAERSALDRTAVVVARLRAALDELRQATAATAAAHDRIAQDRIAQDRIPVAPDGGLRRLPE